VLSTGLVKFGGEVVLRVQVDNAKDAQITQVPDVDGLELRGPGPPAISSYSTNISGRLYSKSTISWTIIVRPEKPGDFSIPALTLEIDGEQRSVPDQPLTLKVVKDLEGLELGFLELVGQPTRVYEGQPFTIDLRFGWDARLDVASAGLFLPWWGSLPGTLEVKGPARDLSQRWMPLNVNRNQKAGVAVLEDAQRDDTPFKVLQLKRSFIATRPGVLQFPQSTFEFAEIDPKASPLSERRYKDYYSILPGFEIDVVRVPEKDRPYEWTGAVGRMHVERRAEPRDVDVGDSIELECSWTGDANLEFFDPPDLRRLDEFRGFRVLGVEDSFFGDMRRVTWELVAMDADLTEVPPVPLWTFDTVAETYVRIDSEAVPIRVRPSESAVELAVDEGEALDILDIVPAPRTGASLTAPGGRLLALAFLGVPLLWLLGRTLVRRRLGDPDAPAARRWRAAPRVLARTLARASGARDQAAALHAFLGARTREPQQAWLGRDAASWRAEHEARLDADAAAELRVLQDELDERAYAADDEPLDPARIERVAARLIRGGL
jgi:hypothetical protein